MRHPNKNGLLRPKTVSSFNEFFATQKPNIQGVLDGNVPMAKPISLTPLKDWKEKKKAERLKKMHLRGMNYFP